jgi:hypothetical protein
MTQEIKDLRRDLYGDPNTRQQGVYTRLDHLDEYLADLRRVVEREKVDHSVFQAMEEKLDQLTLDYRLAIVYLRGIAATTATITVTLIGAAVVGALRFLGGP